MIEQHYKHTFGLGREIYTEFPLKCASHNLTGNTGFIDIADLTEKQIYEIKPVWSETIGVTQLQWYLSFLPGWTPGTIYSKDTPIEIGPSPSSPIKVIVTQMNIPGVIVYWERLKNVNLPPIPGKVDVTESQKTKRSSWQGNLDTQQVVVTCEKIILGGLGILIYFLTRNPSYVPVF